MLHLNSRAMILTYCYFSMGIKGFAADVAAYTASKIYYFILHYKSVKTTSIPKGAF